MIYIVMYEIWNGMELQNKGNFVSARTISSVSTGQDALKEWCKHVGDDLDVDENTVLITGVFRV